MSKTFWQKARGGATPLFKNALINVNQRKKIRTEIFSRYILQLRHGLVQFYSVLAPSVETATNRQADVDMQ
jgi:hypothetical protein